MNAFRPAYLKLHARGGGELQTRADRLKEMLADCRLCARRCGADRLNGERGVCKAPSRVVYSSAHPHGGEEEPLSGSRGSGTIFFTFCNSRCIFCQNYDISQLHHGDTISVESLASLYLAMQRMGCHNVNLVTPTHFVPHIVSALVLAIGKGLTLPLVYNTNGYDSLETLRLLDGIIDIYLPDMKFSDEATARKLSSMPDYPKVNQAAIAEMHRQVGLLQLDEHGVAQCGLIVRHLVMPNNMAGTDIILETIASIDKRIQINLMAQYHPAYRAAGEEKINRRITWQEYEDAVKTADKLGLVNVWTQNCNVFCGH